MAYKTIITVLLLQFTTVALGLEQSPTEVVEKAISSVLEALQSEQAALQEDPQRVNDLIGNLILPHFDFVNMSRWILGKTWNTMTTQQQEQFIEQFKLLLIRNYAHALLDYSGGQFNYFPAKQINDKIAVVKTELQDNKSGEFLVEYRLYRQADRWRVIDVGINGVSLVVTYRGSFADQIKNVGIDGLIANLKQKNSQENNN